MARNWIVVCVAFGILAGASGLEAQERRVNAALERRTGEKTRGPATIALTRVNVLRYDVLVGVSVTFAGGPDLRVPFIPPIPAPPAAAKAKAEVEVTRAAEDPVTVEGLLARLAALERDRFESVQGEISKLIEVSNLAKRRLDAAIAGSDGALRTQNGPTELVNEVAAVAAQITAALKPKWPTDAITQQLANLAEIRTDLAGINTSKLDVDQQQRTFEYISSRIPILEQWYAAVAVESEAARHATEAQGRLASWRPILASIGEPSAFDLAPVTIDCGFGFGGSKESKVELVKRDRTGAPGAAEAREDIVTVVCSSPFSVSGGFAVSSVDRQIPAFVPAPQTTIVDGVPTTTVASRFGYSDRSGSRTLPLLLVNTRLHEPSDTWSVQFSAGAAVDLAGKVGTDVEYVLGGTVAFKREVFLTLGWHFAHTRVLVGFEEDQLVPSGLAEPPLEKGRDSGVMLAVTFRLR